MPRMVTLARASTALLAGFILLVLSQCGSADPAAEQNSDPSEAPSQAAIKRAYTMKCSLCHGTDGRLMASKAPDLSTSTMTIEERIAIITYGKGTMPPQKGILDPAIVRGIADYVGTFQDVK